MSSDERPPPAAAAGSGVSESERLQRFQAVFDASKDAVCIVDAARRCAELNPAACELLGYARDELISRPVCELVAELERADAEAIWKTLEAKGRAGGTLQLVCKDGARKEVEFRAVGAALPGLHVLTARDLTEQRRLEERLRNAEKMEAVGRLAGGVAHDFNNLLTIVSISAEALLTQPHTPEEARDALTEIGKAAARGARLTRQLLAFGRRQVLRPKPISLNTLVGGMSDMLRRLIGEDVTLAVDLDPRLVEVRADPSQLEQVMLNLAANARDAMPQGGTLLVQTRNAMSRDASGTEVAAWVVLSVTDTGCGMDEETKRHLFEPFFTTKEVGQGTGLGLASIYGIVVQTGGRIEVESESGAGSTFRISFPAVSAPEVLEEAAHPAATARGGSETILLAEDEPQVRRLLARHLRQRGYQVIEAEDGIQALELAGRHSGRIDLLVTDAVMPHVSGRMLARRLRVERPHLRVLFVSGYSAEAAGAAPDRDGTALLQKPFTAEDVAARIRELLDAVPGVP